MKMPMCLAGLVVSTVAGSVQGQVLVSRSSTISYSYAYGAGTDMHIGGDSRTQTELSPVGDDNIDFGGNTDGVLETGEAYSAGGNLHAHYHFDIPGYPNDIDGIHLDALVHAHSMASGAGTSAMRVSNPGDEVILVFQVFSTIEFHLNGSIDSPMPVPESFVALQRLNGESWETVFTSQSNPEGRGPFDAHGMLTSGTYRMHSQLTAEVEGEAPPLDVHCMYNLELPGISVCRADFNQDNVVDFFDYLDFVDAFASNSPSADFNQDGVIDFFDYLDFVDQFASGCN